MTESNEYMELFTSEIDLPDNAKKIRIQKEPDMDWSKENIKDINKPVFKDNFGLKNISISSSEECFKLIFTDTFFDFLLNQVNKRIEKKEQNK